MNQPRLVELVSSYCVPLALNVDRIPPGPAGKMFFDAIHRTEFAMGTWVVTPDGKTLSYHYHVNRPGESGEAGYARLHRETVEKLEAALKAFGPLEPRKAVPDPLPGRGEGYRPGGGVRLVAWGTELVNGKRDGQPLVESVELSKDEWAAFAPPKREVGSEWPLPEAVARKFVKLMHPSTDGMLIPRPKDATEARMVGAVEWSDGKTLRLRYGGWWKSLHYRDDKPPENPIRTEGAADGLAEADAATGRVKRVLIVFRGFFHNPPPYTHKRHAGAVAEWREE